MTRPLIAFFSLTLEAGTPQWDALVALSDRLQAVDFRVVWVSLDRLGGPHSSSPEIPWLRLGEVALAESSWRCRVGQADKLAMVLDALGASALVPWGEQAYWGAHFAAWGAGISVVSENAIPTVTVDTLPPAPVGWRILLSLAAFLVAPKRARRMRGELSGAKNLATEIMDDAFYKERYLSVEDRMTPLDHYLGVGQFIGCDPNPLFWQTWYARRYLAKSDGSPWFHYVHIGGLANCQPNPFFDSRWYRQQIDLPLLGIVPLLDYLRRYQLGDVLPEPSPLFDSCWYEENYGSGGDLPLIDFVLRGADLPTCDYLARHPELRHKTEEKNLSYAAVFECGFIFGSSRRPFPVEATCTDPRPVERIAVCSVLTGQYDRPRHIGWRDPNTDYFLLTDHAMVGNLSGWEVLSLDVGTKDSLKLSRFAKMHLMHLIPKAEKYDVIVYLDANIELRGTLSTLLDGFFMSGAKLGFVPHPFRGCVYQEAAAVLACGADSPENVARATVFLDAKGFPANWGLFELNFFCFRPGLEANRLLEQWWDLYCQYGKRDQLLLPYVVWKQGVVLHPLLPSGQSVRTHPSMTYHPHAS